MTIKRLIYSVIALIALAAAWLSGSYMGKSESSTSQIRANSEEYNFINPLLYSDSPKESSSQFRKLEDKLYDYIKIASSNKEAERISVYFRDLNTGKWTGVNEELSYVPSSMMKIVTMIAALKTAEKHPGILSSKVSYKPGEINYQTYEPALTLPEGDYSLDKLIENMIINSDNAALNAVLGNKEINSEFTRVYESLGLPNVSTTSAQKGYMSPKSFSGVFRSLYNSSFFQWTLSEQVLALLARTSYTGGLMSGVPTGTVVAHKFGENTNIELPEGRVVSRELHDCGIVYFPDHPYFLCIMTRGQDFSRLEKSIREISELVWGFARYKLYAS